MERVICERVSVDADRRNPTSFASVFFTILFLVKHVREAFFCHTSSLWCPLRVSNAETHWQKEASRTDVTKKRKVKKNPTQMVLMKEYI